MRFDARWMGAVVGIIVGGAALAGDLPGLPGELRLPKGADSPGQVVFRHDTHVDGASPGCVSCHPRRFGILGRSAERRAAAVTHAAMEKGEACGGCHAKEAFGFDDCTACHAE